MWDYIKGESPSTGGGNSLVTCRTSTKVKARGVALTLTTNGRMSRRARMVARWARWSVIDRAGGPTVTYAVARGRASGLRGAILG